MKDGFLVEVSESSRKLRHVFLFTDVLLCAKLKKASAGWVCRRGGGQGELDPDPGGALCSPGPSAFLSPFLKTVINLCYFIAFF